VSLLGRVGRLIAGVAAVFGLVTGAAPATSAGVAGSSPAVSVAHAEQQAGYRMPRLPIGGREIFDHRILVAYYGTAHSASLGVLGSAPPGAITKRLRAAARPFGTKQRPAQIVYELVASVADASPGADGDYSHYIPNSYVREYVRAAHRHHALLVLDLQPGRSSFLPQAQHFQWALRDPSVGLALDPEWRMGPHQVPAQTIGSVKAVEVNQVSRYVAGLVRRRHLPQKLFMVHQFTTAMVKHIGQVRKHGVLAMVQHVDGFGSRRAKLATYHNVARPQQFHLGFKLFYHQDSDLFHPRQVLRIHPRVDFVSYQ
jgi:hypothetical protein